MTLKACGIMKLAPGFSVPLWTLLLFSALLKTSQAQSISVECDSNGTLTISILSVKSTATPVTEAPNLDCNSVISNFVNKPDTSLIPGAVYQINYTCSNCSKQLPTMTTKPASVKGLSVIAINTSSLSLNWTKPDGNSSFYKVQWTDGVVSNTVNATATSTVITNLTSGVSYNISVSAVADDGVTEGDPSYVSQYTKPNTIANVNVSQNTNSIFLNWTSPPGQVFVYKVEVNSSVATSFTKDVFLVLSDLTAGTPYEIKVIAVAGDNRTEGLPYTLNSFTRPQQPSALMRTPNTSDGTSYLSISWSLPNGMVNSFVVNISGIDLKRNISTTLKTANVTNLNPGRLYSITVTAVAGPYTNTSDTFYFATAPVSPAFIIISQRTNSSLSLQWPTPSLMVDAPNIYYYITYQPENGTVQNKTSSFNSTELDLLTSGTLYSISVATVGPQNLSSTVVSNSSFTLPNPVINLKVNVNTSAIQLTWLRPNDYKPSYIYCVETYNGSELVKNSSTTTESETLVNLIPGNLYNFRVFTVVNGFRSSEQNISSYTLPEVVSNIAAIGSTTNMSVSWTPAAGQVASYTVQLYRNNITTAQLLNSSLNGSASNTLFQGLTPGVLYCVVVVSSTGTFEQKSPSVCNATFPNPPGPITVDTPNVTSINFTWSSPVGMTSVSYNFTINGNYSTQNNWYLLENLESGSPYILSVVTVAALNYISTAVTNKSYTRPYAVTQLQQEQITTTSVNLSWVQKEKKSFYSYLVQFTNVTLTANETQIQVPNLMSGSNYSFTVTTTAHGTLSDPVTVSYFTRPYSVRELMAQTINTTTINLTWMQPQDYKKEYTYFFQTSGCGSLNNSQATQVILITDLIPGNNCTFCVTVRAADGTNGDAQCTWAYTMPAAVQPSVSSQGSNSSILVSWAKPPGNVELYKVCLNSSCVFLNASFTSFPFAHLSAGMLYTAMVTTVSGPHQNSSGNVTNATFPNPPGPIKILSKTTSSIVIAWGEPPLMSEASFAYQLPNISSQGAGYITTTTTNYTFSPLLSGTSYNISVATVGVMGFVSTMVWSYVTTKPFAVQFIRADVTTDINITVKWTQPKEYKPNYNYIFLFWQNQSQPFNQTVNDINYTITGLTPGSFYNFSVSTVTSDGTESDQTGNSSCTNASPVVNLNCVGPNKTEAILVLSWEKPKGNYSGFKVTNNNNIIDDKVLYFNKTITGLQYYTPYEVSVVTQSCGQPSPPEHLRCQTGITYPNIPSNFESLLSVVDITYNSFSLRINPNLLSDVNKGPITHVGVLVAKNPPPNTNLSMYLNVTYDQWKKIGNGSYLATVKENIFQIRGASSVLTIAVGDNSIWMKYTNGPLEAKTKYRFAIVLFTSLNYGDLVNEKDSIVSITNFYPDVTLPENPVVIGIAAGVTAGFIFVILFILIIVILRKRLLSEKSSDIQIHPLRGKVSVAVRLEDYEAYYKKQKADSNCGFAEEFEDLKPVGTSQTKTNALSLENKPKNRYNNVLPYDSSRVKLSIIHGNPNDDYINANYMPGYNSRKEFIAAQGPLPTTVNDFWRMIWEKNVQTLVMLTRCNEQGRIKCEQYWSSGTKHYGNITVSTISEIPLEDWTIRDFSIKNVKTAETRSVRHFHFTAWPDHGVPETTELLISFRHLVREHMDQYSKHSPTVVHCSAGVGRTGTLITIDRLIFQIERENIVDVYGIVHDLRMHRPLMVQTEDQYVFLNQCALDIIRSRTGNNVDLIYQNAAALSIYENVEPKKGFIKNGYKA